MRRGQASASRSARGTAYNAVTVNGEGPAVVLKLTLEQAETLLRICESLSWQLMQSIGEASGRDRAGFRRGGRR